MDTPQWAGTVANSSVDEIADEAFSNVRKLLFRDVEGADERAQLYAHFLQRLTDAADANWDKPLASELRAWDWDETP